MSATVDNRIVNAQFNNKDFEKNVSTTLTSLDKLKRALDFKSASNGMSTLQSVASKFSLANISSSLEGISGRFTTMGIIGVTALTNITNSAINAGKQLVKSLTVEPILTGLDEYETKMNAITTILTNTSSKGTTLEDVNEALAELNTYADLTIYNFAEMTRNIGTFTAAGIDLDSATSAIKGIANLAAGSGSTSEQASRAMYQLSQAMAAGTLLLQDWNSVVNAGMGGELFQNELIKQAKAAGTWVDEWDKALNDGAASFRGLVSEGFITRDVLVNAFNAFSEDQMLIDAATQVKTWTQLMSVMAESVQSGWAVTWEHIIGDRAQAIEVLTRISNAFSNLVGPTADARNEMLGFWNANGGRDAVIDGLASSFNLLLDILKPIKDGFREIFPALTGERLVEMSIAFRDFVQQFKIGEETGQKLQTFFEGFFSIFDTGLYIIQTVAGAFFELGSSMDFGDFSIVDSLKNIGEYLLFINSSVKDGSFKEWLGNAVDRLKELGLVVTDYGIRAIDFIKDLNIRLLSLSEITTLVTDKWKDFKDALVPFFDFIKQIGTKVSEIGELVRTKFSQVFAGVDWSRTFEAGAVIGAIVVLEKLTDKIMEIVKEGPLMLDSIKGILGGVQESLEAYQNSIKADTILKIAVAIGIMSVSLIALAAVDPERLGSALVGMTGILLGLFGSSGVLTLIGKGTGINQAMRVTTLVIGLSIAMNLLASAAVTLSGIPADKIGEALVSMTSIMTILSATAGAMSFIKDKGSMITTASALVIMSLAIKVLAGVVEQLGALDLGTLQKGIVSIGVLMGLISAFSFLNKFGQTSVSTATGMLIMSAGLIILAEAVERFGKMDPQELVVGLSAVGVILAGLGAFGIVAKYSGGMVSAAVALGIISASLLILQKSVSAYGSMDGKELAVGLGAMAIALAALTAALYLIPKDAVLKAAGVLAMSVALGMLVGTIAVLGTLPIGVLIQGLLAIAAALAIFIAAGYLVGPAIVPLFGLAAVIALLGASVFIAASGVAIFASALVLLGTAGAVGIAVLIDGAEAIIDLIPRAMKRFAEGVLEMLETFSLMKDDILDAFFGILIGLGEKVIEYMPELMRVGKEMLLGFLVAVAENTQAVVETGIDIAVAFINGVANKLPDIIDAGFNLIINFLEGMATSLEDNREELIDAINNFLIAVFKFIFEFFVGQHVEMTKTTDELFENMSQAIEDFLPKAIDAVITLLNGVVNAIKGFKDDIAEAAGEAISGFTKGITDAADGIKEGAENVFGGFVDGAKDVLDINSPSKVMELLGKQSDQGFIKGIKSGEDDVADAGQSLGSKAMNAIKDAITKASELFSEDLNPRITPVVDLSQVVEGQKQIKLLGQSLSMGAATQKVSRISGTMASADSGTIGSNNQNGSTSIKFEQNNYSPKALSRSEIYRNTHNQISQFKEAVSSV